jgi:dTDP-4-amino-4,6-dideoxygalactose transaminase
VGDGGAVVTSDEATAQRVSRLRNYGQSERYVHSELGMNSRLDELQAALMSERMRWLNGFTERRRRIASAYDANLCHPRVRLLAPPQEATSHVHHLYVLQCEDRDALSRHLSERGVQTLIHYPVPVHRQRPCTELRRDPMGLPNSEAHAATCVSIPCHPQMGDADVAHVIDAINAWR